MKFKLSKMRVYLVLSTALMLLAIGLILFGATAISLCLGTASIFTSFLYIAEVEDTIKHNGMMSFW